jgi:hypothetical protein
MVSSNQCTEHGDREEPIPQRQRDEPVDHEPPLPRDRVLGLVCDDPVHLSRRDGMVEGPLEINRERVVRLPVESFLARASPGNSQPGSIGRPFTKGNPGGGRPKGAQNKATRKTKE